MFSEYLRFCYMRIHTKGIAPVIVFTIYICNTIEGNKSLKSWSICISLGGIIGRCFDGKWAMTTLWRYCFCGGGQRNFSSKQHRHSSPSPLTHNNKSTPVPSAFSSPNIRLTVWSNCRSLIYGKIRVEMRYVNPKFPIATDF